LVDTGPISVSHISPVQSGIHGMQQHVQEQTERAEESQVQQNGTPEYNNTSQTMTKESLAKAVEGINQMLEISRTHLKFTLHEELHEYYVQVIDERTQEVIKEIPPKKLLDIVAEIWKLAGILVDEKR